MLNYTGTLKVKNETVIVSDKFSKREFVLSNKEDQYPQEIQFQLSQTRCTLLDAHEIGSELTVSFNLRGRAWTNKEGKVQYFNTLDVFKIEGKGGF